MCAAAALVNGDGEPRRLSRRRLKLRLNLPKSAVAMPSQRKFLGFSFTSGTPRRRIAPQALARFKSRVRELTRRTGGADLAQITAELSRYLIGWRGYFGICETPSVLRNLDGWVRRRLRCIAWKQWRRGRTRFAELRHRGVGKDLAGPDRRQRAPSMTAQQQPGACHCTAQCLPRPARPCFLAALKRRLSHRTAVYGPVRTVVWEGRSRQAPAYPDCPPGADFRQDLPPDKRAWGWTISRSSRRYGSGSR
jgi:hypothetical protein